MIAQTTCPPEPKPFLAATPPARSSSSYTTMMTPLLPNAGEDSILGTSRARKLSNCVYRLLTGLQFDSPSSQPVGITVLKLATRPAARSALKIDMPSLAVPAGLSLARHFRDRVVADQTPPRPSLVSRWNRGVRL